MYASMSEFSRNKTCGSYFSLHPFSFSLMLFFYREKTPHWKIKIINSTEHRMEGLCPLTPKEVGIFLQALGYLPSTLIYIAAGEIYGGDSRLSELSSRFPNIVTKVSPP